jgi:hypothetical protein
MMVGMGLVPLHFDWWGAVLRHLHVDVIAGTDRAGKGRVGFV